MHSYFRYSCDYSRYMDLMMFDLKSKEIYNYNNNTTILDFPHRSRKQATISENEILWS